MTSADGLPGLPPPSNPKEVLQARLLTALCVGALAAAAAAGPAQPFVLVPACLVLAACGAIRYMLYRATGLPATCPTRYLRRKATADDPPVVVFLGDSITHGHVCGNFVDATCKRLLNRWAPVNAGVNSQCTHNMLARLDRVLACRPAVVVIMAGTNDVKGMYNAEWGAASVVSQRLPAPPSDCGACSPRSPRP